MIENSTDIGYWRSYILDTGPRVVVSIPVVSKDVNLENPGDLIYWRSYLGTK
jgi:hypothetical protein